MAFADGGDKNRNRSRVAGTGGGKAMGRTALRHSGRVATRYSGSTMKTKLDQA